MISNGDAMPRDAAMLGRVQHNEQEGYEIAG
jgi:hypothetical protein